MDTYSHSHGGVSCLLLFLLLCLLLYTFLSQWEFFLWEILVAFPQGKPAAAESRYPTLINYKVHAGSFRASIIHQTLTWTQQDL